MAKVINKRTSGSSTVVEHSHPPPKVEGLSPAATQRDEMAKIINKKTSNSSAAVEHSPHHPKV